MSDVSAVRPRKSVTRFQHLPLPLRRAIVRSRRLTHASRPPHPQVTVDVAEGVALVAFDDGKVNVISRESAEMLAQAHERVASDEGVKAVVLAGRAGQFSAGFDLDTLMIGGPDRMGLFVTGWEMLRRYYTLPIPLVVACTGNAVAAGAVLLLAGDVRLAAKGDFTIGFIEAAIGLPIPGLGLSIARERLVQEAFEEATAAARMYSPQEALAVGFVQRVVPSAELVNSALAEAARLASLPPESFRTKKEARVRERAALIEAQLQADLELMRRLG